MVDAVRRYNVFSGGGPRVPEWGLGFWYRADARSTQKSVLALAKEFRERKISCDVLGLEPGWQTHAYSCTFEWNGERFDPVFDPLLIVFQWHAAAGFELLFQLPRAVFVRSSPGLP